MWSYEKKLEFPVNIKNPNPKYAQIIISQFGGPDGELGASMRYLTQRYSMPYDEVKAILTDVGIEDRNCLCYNSCNRRYKDMLEDLYNYYRNNMTRTQYEDAETLFYSDERLLDYLCYSYNCYELLHSKGHLSLITNPDALFKTPQAEQQFIMEMKNYIKDVIGIKREDVQYGTDTSNRTEQEAVKN